MNQLFVAENVKIQTESLDLCTWSEGPTETIRRLVSEREHSMNPSNFHPKIQMLQNKTPNNPASEEGDGVLWVLWVLWVSIRRAAHHGSEAGRFIPWDNGFTLRTCELSWGKKLNLLAQICSCRSAYIK